MAKKVTPKPKRKKLKKPTGATPSRLPRADGIPVFCSHTTIVDIESVVANPRNPNHHPGPQVDLLSKIIAGQGWRNPIVVSARSGFVVKGHCRLLAAKHLKKKKVPVDVQNYTSEASEHADLIADNRVAELAEMDRGELKDLIETIDTGEVDLDFTGYIEDEIEALMTAAADVDSGMFDETKKEDAAKSGKAPNQITIDVPLEHVDTVCLWLANGENVTPEGMGKGVLRRCELI